MKNRGTTSTFMGYTMDHSNDVYRVLNMETKKNIHSRDVVWLSKSFNVWFSSNSTSKDDSESEDNEEFIERVKKWDCESGEEVTNESKKREASSDNVH
jgi:hypothetical protein